MGKPKPSGAGAFNLSWTAETEERARRMARERRWSLATLISEALILMDEREHKQRRAS
jgi:hypothetical protein